MWRNKDSRLEGTSRVGKERALGHPPPGCEGGRSCLIRGGVPQQYITLPITHKVLRYDIFCQYYYY